MSFYFQSIQEQASVAYAYDPCSQWYEGGGWIRFERGQGEDLGRWHHREMRIGCGYWLFLTEDAVLAP